MIGCSCQCKRKEGERGKRQLSANQQMSMGKYYQLSMKVERDTHVSSIDRDLSPFDGEDMRREGERRTRINNQQHSVA